MEEGREGEGSGRSASGGGCLCLRLFLSLHHRLQVEILAFHEHKDFLAGTTAFFQILNGRQGNEHCSILKNEY